MMMLVVLLVLPGGGAGGDSDAAVGVTFCSQMLVVMLCVTSWDEGLHHQANNTQPTQAQDKTHSWLLSPHARVQITAAAAAVAQTQPNTLIQAVAACSALSLRLSLSG